MAAVPPEPAVTVAATLAASAMHSTRRQATIEVANGDGLAADAGRR
jgi:hypothetical protein